MTRQAMHQLLGGLQEAGLVSAGGQGRVQRYSVTPEGQRIITAASAAVAAVEEQMLSGLKPSERLRLHRDLERCTAALGGTDCLAKHRLGDCGTDLGCQDLDICQGLDVSLRRQSPSKELPMPVTGPDFISLQVRDLDRSAAFYEQYLGLVRNPAGPPHAVVFDTKPVAFAVANHCPGST